MWSDADSNSTSNRSTTLTHAPSSGTVDRTDTESQASLGESDNWSPAPSTLGPATPPQSAREEPSPRTGTPPTQVARLVHYPVQPADHEIQEFPLPADASPTDSDHSEELRILNQEDNPPEEASPPSWLRHLEEEDDCYGC